MRLPEIKTEYNLIFLMLPPELWNDHDPTTIT